MSAKIPALGKGLAALLKDSKTDITVKTSNDDRQEYKVDSVCRINLNNIEINPFQPRTHFKEEKLLELASSIKEHGIIQPITVRKIGNNQFQIISGERRYKASKLAKLEEIPAYIRIADDQSMLEMAIIENVQRQDLNAIEIAISYQRLIDECNITQVELSTRIGKNRTTITNYLRLLRLPDLVQAGLRDNVITMGHARALLSLKTDNDIIKAYKNILSNKLSVRKTEELSRNKNSAAIKSAALALSRYEKRLQEDISHNFDTKVKIKKSNNGNGNIIIRFSDNDELNRLLDILNKY